MDTMKTLMVLGGSNCQLHASKRAAERGIRTVLIDYTERPPGREIADVHLQISTFDAEACIEAGRREGIDGVLAVGTDQPVLTAARVAEALSLPSALSVSQALAVTNKRRMKEVYRAHDIRTPDYLYLTRDGCFTDAAGAECACRLRAPLVIKPLDSQGQRGVFKVSSVEEALRFLPETLSFSREDSCLIEEYIESDEITVSGWVREGQLFPLTIVDRLHYPDEVHIGVCTGHRYPSVHIAQKEEILRLSERVAAAFVLTEGPFYFQILRAPDGSLYANEIACRIGGAFEDITIPHLTGFDILDAAIDLALGAVRGGDHLHTSEEDNTEDDSIRRVAGECCGEEDSRNTETRTATSARMNKEVGICSGWESTGSRCFVPLFFCKPGKIAEITPQETILALPGVADCGYNFKAGDTIPAMHNATARFGHAVVFGKEEEMASRIRKLFDTLQVTGSTGEDLLRRNLYDEVFSFRRESLKVSEYALPRTEGG
ncbi:MAG: ATP-grasp domain-containing protein [Lachnospiraceae bacterium]|nr:ATP-grasp domain-containing protein [Lachnospiraceae bacterium]